MFSKAQVAQMQQRGLAARNGAPVPPPAKRRKPQGQGDWSKRKAWWAEMARQEGVFLALRTVTEKNSGGHWRTKDARAALQRTMADTVVWNYIRVHKIKLPVTVTLTRYGPRVLDSDNAVSALAHVRDGIADAFGTDDSATCGIRWVYAEQVKTGKGLYGVRVLIEKTQGSETR